MIAALSVLVCLSLVISSSATSDEDYQQGPVMWLLDAPVPMERSLRSLGLTKLKERAVAGQGGHFPFYKGLGRK